MLNTINQPIPLTRQHRFKDTFALFIVFLSFNHFTSLCLLIIFIIATRIHNLVANSFITLFLSKSPSPSINEITHEDELYQHSSSLSSSSSPSNHHLLATSLAQSAQSKLSHIYHSQPKKINRLPTQANLNLNLNSNIVSSNKKNILPQQSSSLQDTSSSSFSSFASSSYASSLSSLPQQQQVSPLYLCLEILIATLARLYAGNYFIIPIENLATSIFASFLINNPNECLSYATSCSVLYAISLNVFKRLSMLLILSKNSSITGSLIYLLQQNNNNNYYLSITNWFPYLNVNFLPSWINIDSKYLRIIRYYLSFHVVVMQFSLKALNIQSPHDLTSSLKINLPSSVSTSTNNENDTSQNLSSSSSSSNDHNTTTTSQSTSKSNIIPHPREYIPYFTNIVKSIKSFEPTVTISGNELQSSNTTTTSSINNNNNNNNNNTNNNNDDKQQSNQNFTNQLYELNVDLDSNKDVNNLKDDITVTTNLENFIRYLFKRKTQYIISPLWSIFVTLKTTSFEKTFLKNDHIEINNNNNTNDNEITDSKNKSVFNNIDSDSMALIAQNKSDDYNQLNLITVNNNIFNKKENDYKVCIIDIATHTLTFHIENLTDGELIVLVNGLIWSEVSCALILEHAGEEYVVVSGLVPSCSYDIQFINRLRHKDDYSICDLIIRTKSVDVDKYEVENNFGTSNEFEKLDFSFPSYYHRKFLSPLLTLKHSILTTNANLIEERTKLKKTKREANKKLTSLRQEIDHLKTKIKQNETNDEKNAFKIENLKNTIQQNETALESLEKEIMILNDKEINLEETYLKRKDSHLQKELEFSKIEEKYKHEFNQLSSRENKLKNDYKQIMIKKEKLDNRHEMLQKEVTQNNELFEKYKTEFINRKRKERTKRTENRIREINDLELSVKALEQDVNRLENENENMKNISNNY